MTTTKVSDFKVAEYMIRNLCKRCGAQFVDVPVDFSDAPGVTGQKISVKDDGKLSKTVFQIITSYLQGLQTITGTPCDLTNEEKTAFITYVASVLRELSYAKDAFPEAFTDKPTVLYANRQPLVWIMLRDIICPALNIPIKNVKVVSAKSGRIDCARFIPESSHGPYVFLNGEVENQGVRAAYMLKATLDAMGVDGKGILNHVMSRDELWKKVRGLAQAAMIETDLVNDFVMTLAILSDFSNIDGALEEKKTAKWNRRGLWSQAQSGNLWWQLGLIEKMLEPERGPDWSGYIITKPFIEDFWDRVDAEKQRRGMDELPMELLLRVQSEEFKQRPDLTIQGLLADNRVW
jgi:hypothetical protein